MNGTGGEGQPEAAHSSAAGPAASPVLAGDVAGWRAALAALERDVPDAERVDQLRVLEELKSAACAAQARIAVDLDASQRREQAAAGVPLARRGQGVGAQVALARRESPHRGGRLLGLAKALTGEMPCTLRALREGKLSEWRATLLVKESACLSVADRGVFDAELAADPQAFEGLGDRQLVARAKQVAYRLDAASVVRRARKAEGERCVSLRPAPDTMSYLAGLLPVAQGVAVWAALKQAADTARARGDARSRGQVMADTLVERVTGQASAEQVPIEVQVVMTERTLLAGDDEPAHVPGYGTVPGRWARRLVTERLAALNDHGVGTGRGDGDGERCVRGRVGLWLRRLFTSPTSGQLVAMDSRRRTVPAGLARFITARDQTCRSPWCDAPIRHVDHIVPHAQGGATSAQNLEGYCEACNYAKQAPGWHTRAAPTDADASAGQGRRTGEDEGADHSAVEGDVSVHCVVENRPEGHLVETTTPTGHHYSSAAPDLPGHRPRAEQSSDDTGNDDDAAAAAGHSVAEQYLAALIAAA